MPPQSDDAHEAAWGLREVEFAEMLGRIRAHHLVALERYVEGDVGGALVYATRPIIELLPNVSRELWRRPQSSKRLSDALSSAAYAVRRGAPVEDAKKAFIAASRATKEAASARLGERADDPGFVGSVVVSLLRTAAAAYEEALRREDERALSVLHDARGMVRSALLAYRGLGEAIPEGDEAGSAFEALLVAAAPDEERNGAGDPFRAAVTTIAEALAASVGAVVDHPSGPADGARRAAELALEAAEAYSAGEQFRAAEISGRAYVEHYSQIANSVALVNPGHQRDLDALLGNLRRAINDKAPPTEVDAAADRAAGLLEKVGELLAKHYGQEENGPPE